MPEKLELNAHDLYILMDCVENKLTHSKAGIHQAKEYTQLYDKLEILKNLRPAEELAEEDIPF